MIGQVFTDYAFTHYPQWHWVELTSPTPPTPVEIPTIIGKRKRAFSIVSIGGADVYTGINSVDASLGKLYKTMGDLAGD